MKTKSLLPAMALLAAAAHASVIQFVDVPTHVNDGSFYVLPYQVTIDGKPQLVTCYDIYDDVSFGDTWQAQLLTIDQASISGYFSSDSSALAKYKEVAWLDAQTYTNTDEQIGLQYAIWDVFGTYRSTPASLSYDAAATAAAASNYAGFDFSNVRFIEQTGGVPAKSGTEQAFVFWQPAQTAANSTVPEPRSLLLALTGAFFIAAMVANRRRRPKPMALRASQPRS